jgi:hypothetical protein
MEKEKFALFGESLDFTIVVTENQNSVNLGIECIQGLILEKIMNKHDFIEIGNKLRLISNSIMSKKFPKSKINYAISETVMTSKFYLHSQYSKK